jgi:hypothetical protein
VDVSLRRAGHAALERREPAAATICTATTSPKGPGALVASGGRGDDRRRRHLERGEGAAGPGDRDPGDRRRVPDEYLAGSRKVLAAEQVETFEGHVRSMCEQMARISIEPRWARFDDFGAGRIPACLSKLASRADAE